MYWLFVYRVRPEALGERDADAPSTVDVDNSSPTESAPRDFTSNSIAVNPSSQTSHSDGLSQCSSSSGIQLSQQTLSQDVRMGDVDESDDIEDFDDDIIW